MRNAKSEPKVKLNPYSVEVSGERDDKIRRTAHQD